jgi:hypothetical protein
MTRWLATSATACVVWTCGCGAIEDTWSSTPEARTAIAPAQEVASAPAEAPESVPAPSSTPAPASAPTSAPPPARAIAPTPRPRTTNLVRLSAGTSLPQSLPTGTTMSFSVDYGLRQKPGNSSIKYFWVIERTMGSPLAIPVQLRAKGTLTQLTTGWRPEHGPFRCYIALRNSSGKLTPVSATVPLS